MSYNDVEFLNRLDDPLAKDIALDHEITATIIHIKDKQLPTTPIRATNGNTTRRFHIGTQTRGKNRRLNYELLNQFLLYCELGHVLHLEKYIKHPNIDIDFQNSRGHTPAMVAIIHNQTSKSTPKLVKLLFDGGADADLTDYDGKTVFNYACDHAHESVLYALIRCGINTYHRLLPTLSHIQNEGHLNILYTLIMHFAVEKAFSARCGVCNHTLKEQKPLKKKQSTLKCCIGMKGIRKNEVYYKCGSEYGCWGNYVVCAQCYEYGILRFMMDNTKDKKYNSLNKLEKYEVDNHIKKYNLENPLKNRNKIKNKAIHIYSSYPHHFDENIHCPLEPKNAQNAAMSITETLITMANAENDSSDDSDSDDDDDDDKDSEDSDSDSDSDSDDDNGKKKKKNDKDPDEAPNFKEGKGKRFMNYILTKPKYFYGEKVLREKEWREIYWMDITMQLKWCIMIRQKVFNGVMQCLLSKKYLNIEIVKVIMEMICGTSSVSACFLKQK